MSWICASNRVSRPLASFRASRRCSGRLGSLNAFELAAHSSFFRRWLGQPVCSADSVGRVTALMDAEGLRRGIHHIYDRLKRNIRTGQTE